MEKQQTQIRLPAEMFKEIKRQARENNRSMNGQLLELVQKGMKSEKQEAERKAQTA
ncbi:Arc family DNA-binding protein [Thiothrix litoralis]|uniref:Arc family DNA-binding protein n=1 Tax=Thiothrix litoralis TaxID=2891210 RepID=A0ABX7WUQ1_9GAMM|nr:Arc family DNA-binding protein [Thiothrix litoralis]QTR45389.1 Arc family DNA-binding protein [Thiothrix litoralis]